MVIVSPGVTPATIAEMAWGPKVQEGPLAAAGAAADGPSTTRKRPPNVMATAVATAVRRRAQFIVVRPQSQDRATPDARRGARRGPVALCHRAEKHESNKD